MKFKEREAIVSDTIHPRRVGRVRWSGSWWPARCQHDMTLPPDTIVRVVNIENITLWVEPYDLSI